MQFSKRFALFALVLMVAVAGTVFATTGDRASADIVPGEHSLEVKGPGLVQVGTNFTVLVANDHAEPPFESVTWHIPYDPLVVSVVSMTPLIDNSNANCPSPSTSDSGVRVLLGCLSFAGDTITFSGDVFEVEFSCDAIGPTDISLNELLDTGLTATGGPPAFHDHDPNIACADLADLEVTKTSPDGPVFVAGDTVEYHIHAENLGPAFAQNVVVADDLPDDKVFVSCTLTIDDDGDTVPEIPPGTPCTTPLPGSSGPPGAHFPVFPNPFPPPANLINVVFTSTVFYGLPGLAMGGTIDMVITVDIPDDQAGKVEANLALAASTDQFAPGETPDGSFFDDCNGDTNPVDFPTGNPMDCSDNNLSLLINPVAPADVEIEKTCPPTAADGDTIQCTVTVTNNGPSPAADVVITDTPSGSGVQVAGSVTPDANSVCAGGEFPCTTPLLASGASTVITVDYDVSTGTFCNQAHVEWADPMASSLEVCVIVNPPFNGLVKGADVDGDTIVDFPGEGEDTIEANLWICVNQATDGIDNDGDSTVDNEDPTCPNTPLEIGEYIFTSEDCDTRNDDDDDDGQPVDGSVADGSTTDYVGSNPRPECPQPTISDYQNDLVDKDGGEEPEGLGAFEFQLKFDHKIFDIEITESDEVGPDDWANGRTVNCSMTIITENDIRFGCVTVGPLPLGHAQVSGILGATITVSPEADLIFRIRPGKDNGVVRRLLDENCEVADIFGDIFPDTNAGLTQDCTDIDLTVRRLEGDLDTDCDVDVLDAQRIAFRYGSFFGQLLFNQLYDLEPFVTGDFDIDIKDLQFVFGRDGSTCDDPLPDNQDPESAEGVGQP
jgi:uncharacterized repeat protein (TIGR01451 family)